MECGAREHRRAVSNDCIQLAKVTDALDGFRIQATGIVPSDVPEEIADCYRLVFSLVFCSKPVITGTFRKASFNVMRDMLAVIAGGKDQLRTYPNAIFDCCPSPPLKWSDLTVSALIDCARSGLPAELVSMPLAGATAPVTLIGSVTQHAAECLSGVILHQMAGTGSPIIWGGSPAAFDMRHGTPPMGAMETMMIDLAYAQIGKTIGLPTHAYMACSDAKSADYQAGLESGIGAVLAALGGINIVSGPGFLNYENTQNLEKLLLDHDACQLAFRLISGIHPRTDIDAIEIIRRNAETGRFLSDPSTRQYHKAEISPPGNAVNRGSLDDWVRQGSPTSRDIARKHVEDILSRQPNRLDETRCNQLTDILFAEAEILNSLEIVKSNVLSLGL